MAEHTGPRINHRNCDHPQTREAKLRCKQEQKAALAAANGTPVETPSPAKKVSGTRAKRAPANKTIAKKSPSFAERAVALRGEKVNGNALGLDSLKGVITGLEATHESLSGFATITSASIELMVDGKPLHCILADDAWRIATA